SFGYAASPRKNFCSAFVACSLRADQAKQNLKQRFSRVGGGREASVSDHRRRWPYLREQRQHDRLLRRAAREQEDQIGADFPLDRRLAAPRQQSIQRRQSQPAGPYG